MSHILKYEIDFNSPIVKDWWLGFCFTMPQQFRWLLGLHSTARCYFCSSELSHDARCTAWETEAVDCNPTSDTETRIRKNFYWRWVWASFVNWSRDATQPLFCELALKLGVNLCFDEPWLYINSTLSLMNCVSILIKFFEQVTPSICVAQFSLKVATNIYDI